MEHLLAEPGCLSNGHVAQEPPKKTSNEGIVEISFNNRSVKLPRRKVSAVRNFPPGCGRFAENLSQGKPNDDVVSDHISESLNIKIETSSIQPDTVEPLKDTKLAESLNPPQDVDLANNLDMVNGVIKDFVEPSDQTITDEPPKASNPETRESLGELTDLGKSDEPKILEGPNLIQLEPVKMSSALEQTEAIHLAKDFASPQIPTSAVEAKEEYQQKEYVCMRRVSAIRDFPPYCGRHAPQLSKEECLEFLAKNRKVIADSEKPILESVPPMDIVKSNVLDANLEVKSTVKVEHAYHVKIEDTSGQDDELQVVAADESKLDISGARETSTGKRDKVVRSSAVAPEESKLKFSGVIKTSRGKSDKVVRRSVVGADESKLNRSGVIKNSRGKSAKVVQSSVVGGDSKDNLVGGSNSENYEIVVYQSEELNVESFADKVVVLALMAAPNCPWRHDKKFPKSKKDIKPLINSDRTKVKKEKKEYHHSLDREKVNEKGVRLGNMLPDFCVTLTPFGVPSLERKNNDIEENARKKVRETLRLFQVCCRKLLQEEESKSKDQGQTTKRVDLRASSLLKEKNKWVNTGKQILGSVPGVELGDEFHFRVELAIIGLHRQYMAGIDYLKENGHQLATSIVASGGYNDELDNSDVLIYSGHGGQNASGDKKHEDQKLIRGNLALKNSMEAQTPVRVIRGFKEKASDAYQDSKSKMVATYTYDGLYLVEKYWMEKEHHGGSVFKFQMRRMPGQPELALRIMKKTKKSSVREGLCIVDISEGNERIPISAVNLIDDEKPYPFKYITKAIYPSWYNPEPPRGCDCTKGCSDSENCFCAVKNGGEIPFNHDGAIVEAKPLVYECGPSCKCPPSCYNRVSQRGIKVHLEVFKTEARGWGVRSLTSIPSGSFICEYTGVVLKDTEAEERTGNDEYLFDIGNNYNDHSLWDGLSTVIPALQTNAICEVVETVGFTIDAADYGNVGRFINHSCSPNLYAQNLLYDHDDKTLPHIMFFAAENIPPLQELTYHYNYTIDQVRDANGDIKKKPCFCGSHECTGRLY
ncbi:histone-lysine N-methyltransferase, H3 lysine-9 specific SUVH6-like [Aristolochia californica]|uniref:histone-lysine N-methyltransferase, H3 lysine-9 specific SUVH6-like n=1 Tax=Aristolochia californica TaxID=171875 RepID=UPI0035DC87D3